MEQGLSTQTALKLRHRCDQRAFHDFVLARGILPPEILKDALLDELVPKQVAREVG
jgi:uncharacterized protein (DUF885 family)